MSAAAITGLTRFIDSDYFVLLLILVALMRLIALAQEAREVERRRARDAELERIKQDQLARTNNQTGVRP